VNIPNNLRIFLSIVVGILFLILFFAYLSLYFAICNSEAGKAASSRIEFIQQKFSLIPHNDWVLLFGFFFLSYLIGEFLVFLGDFLIEKYFEMESIGTLVKEVKNGNLNAKVKLITPFSESRTFHKNEKKNNRIEETIAVKIKDLLNLPDKKFLLQKSSLHELFSMFFAGTFSLFLVIDLFLFSIVGDLIGTNLMFFYLY